MLAGGEVISRKLADAEWGDGVVDQLAERIVRSQPGLRGFARHNLFRMRQFYEAYQDNRLVPALLTQLPWTHKLIILSQSNGEAMDWRRKPESKKANSEELA